MRELIGAREISPVEVVDHFLGRIEEFQPKLKAFKYLDAAGLAHTFDLHRQLRYVDAIFARVFPIPATKSTGAD